jgi:hypothetical protein
MTLLELIRQRLNEAEAVPGAPSRLIDAVDALADYVECQGALPRGDMRCWCWLGAYFATLGNVHVYPHEGRTLAKAAAYSAVSDYDAFIASVQPRDEGHDA